MQCSAFILTELHKQSSQAQTIGDIRDRARVVGISIFITSTIFFIIVFSLSVINYFYSLNITKIMPFIPEFKNFFDSKSIISGMIFGLFISPFIRYFIWSANYKIKSENVLTILALIPCFTLILQIIFAKLNVIQIEDNYFNNSLMLVLVFMITLSAILSAYLKSHKKIKEAEGDGFWQKVKNSSKVESQNLAIGYSSQNMADYEIIKNTVDFYEGDISKTSKILELPEETIQTLILTKNSYSLRDDISKKVHEIFRNKIF